jgi:DNA repair photolyase
LDPAPQASAQIRPEQQTISVREVKCNTLLHELSYGPSAGYTVNLYKGCTHGCVYCYAPSLTHDERKWGTYVDAKVNAPDVLRRELRGLRKHEVFLSSASDPYQPVEARYMLTRKCLEVLLRSGFPVSILTRSPLVLRDLDVIRKFHRIRVGMSVTTVPVRRFEPGVPPLQRRIDTLRKLASAGVSTYVSLAPVIPGIMMVDLEGLFEELSAAGVKSVSYGILRFAGYEESKKMFEAASGKTAAEATEGRDDVAAKLAGLARRYRMTSPWIERDREPWPAESMSLDSFCDGPALGSAEGSAGHPYLRIPAT